MPSVFLSHSWVDKPFVRRLAERLTRDGVVVWLDEAELMAGDSLIEKISAGIEAVEYVVAVLSRHSVASDWVRRELSLAMAREIRGRRVVVLPVRIEPCPLPAFLRDKLYIDFSDPDGYEAGVAGLLRAMNVAPPPAAPDDAAALVRRVEDFEDLRLVAADKARTYQPSLDRSFFQVYFELSDYAPPAWATLFEALHRPPRDLRWRRAWVEGRFVVLVCPLEEVPLQLRFLKEDVASANAAYRHALIETQARHGRSRRRRDSAPRKDDWLDSLDFD